MWPAAVCFGPAFTVLASQAQTNNKHRNRLGTRLTAASPPARALGLPVIHCWLLQAGKQADDRRTDREAGRQAPGLRVRDRLV